MSYEPFLTIGLLMLMAVAGSSRFVQLVSVEERIARRRQEDEHLSHRVRHLAAAGRVAEAEQLLIESRRKPGPAPKRPSRHLRLAHVALLLLVLFWPASPSQAPVRNNPPSVGAGDDATARTPRPCLFVRQTKAPDTEVS